MAVTGVVELLRPKEGWPTVYIHLESVGDDGSSAVR